MEKHNELRSKAGNLALALLIYWFLLRLAVILIPNGSGWGHLLALALSFCCYCLWKTPAQFREMLSHKEKSMSLPLMLGLFCLIAGAQLMAQLSGLLVRMLAFVLRVPSNEVVGQLPVADLQLPMLLYVCLFGPVAEELLFRGIVLRTLAPYGKKLAILVSALLFGLFHGNLLQTPYAFVLGLVLGYCGLEYRLVWSMALHVGNNLLFAYGLPRLLADLPPAVQNFWIWALILTTAYAGLCLLLTKAVEIRDWFRENPIRPGQMAAVFTEGTVLAFAAIMLLTMII